MSDPIHDLEGLKHSGVDVNPLPAAEVRRRGARLRRRNNALAAAGALAVALVVATPIAVLAHGSDHADHVPVAPSPSPSRGDASGTAWKQEVPQGFDTTALPPGAGFRFHPRAGAEVDDLTLCGRPAFSTSSDDPAAPAVDTAGAYGEVGGEGVLGRTVALYPNDRVAAKVLDAVRHGVASCPTDPNGRGVPLVYAPADTDLPADESFVFTQQARMDKDLLADLVVWQVARVGNALYLATSHTSAGGPQVADGEERRMAEWSAPVLSDMCVFAAEPCDAPGSTDASPVIGEGAVSAIPADFPLGAGLPTADSFGERVPSPALTSCGKTVPTPDVVETARAQWRSVSQIRDRQLMTFSREADAQAYVESVAELYCTVDDLGDGATRVTEGFGGAPFGDFSAIAVSHDVVNGEVGPGLVLTHVVRVGRAVLLAQRIDEAFTWDGDVDQQSVQLKGVSKDELRTVVDEMCMFTDQGC